MTPPSSLHQSPRMPVMRTKMNQSHDSSDFIKRRTRPSYRLVVSITLILGVFLAFYGILWSNAPVLDPDSGSYMRLAHDLVTGQIGTLQQRTIGYPLLLILTGSTFTPTKALFYTSLLLHFAGASLLAYLLTTLGAKRHVVVLLMAICLLPPYVESAAWVMTENVTQCALIVSYVTLMKWLFDRRPLMLVIATASATYTAFVRPTYEALMPMLAVCVVVWFAAGWLTRFTLRRLVAGLAFANAVLIMSLSAYASIVYVKRGYFGTSTMSAYSLSHKTASYVEFMPAAHAELRDILTRHRNSYLLLQYDDHTGQNYIYRAMPELRQYYGNDEVKLVRELQKANLDLIRAKPLSYLNDSLKVLGGYWMPFECAVANAGSSRLRILWTAIQLIIVAAFLIQAFVIGGASILSISLTALVGAPIAVLRRERDRQLICAYLTGLAIIAYTAIVSCFMGIGSARYRTPTDLLIVATSIMGYTLWIRAVRYVKNFKEDPTFDESGPSLTGQDR